MDKAISNADPAEGSREVIERELKRRDQDINGSTQETTAPKPGVGDAEDAEH
jgi:hypothetical protein